MTDIRKPLPKNWPNVSNESINNLCNEAMQEFLATDVNDEMTIDDPNYEKCRELVLRIGGFGCKVNEPKFYEKLDILTKIAQKNNEEYYKANQFGSSRRRRASKKHSKKHRKSKRSKKTKSRRH
jgi:hypothetical protein